MNYKTVSVEILRAGPARNQLLSPLTSYLATCGDCAGSFYPRWEHAKVQKLFRQVLLEQKPNADLSKGLAELLKDLPGFETALDKADSKEIIHIEMVVSASELVMLPFELAGSLKADHLGGTPLLLSKKPKVVLTRRVRGAPRPQIDQSADFRTLFISAVPDGLRVPVREHLSRIVEHLRDEEDADGGTDSHEKKLDDHLTILHCATLDQIHKACKSTSFSFVHILAHGVESDSGDGKFVGLALHNPQGGTHIVSGADLAAALLSGDGTPAMVNLAVCDSARQPDVVCGGSSVAHELHAAGVPLVVASQFPLTFDASIMTLDQLYGGLSSGRNWLEVLHDTRQQLVNIQPGHEWGGLVTYASLPPDLNLPSRHKDRASSAVAEFLHVEQGKLSRFSRLSNLSRVPDGAVDKPSPIDSMLALSFIRWASTQARFIVSVDFEMVSWSHIINQEVEDEARIKFPWHFDGNARRSLPSSDRYDDFQTLFDIMCARLHPSAGYKYRPLLCGPAIIRTFVLHKRAEDLTVADWCILRRIEKLEQECAGRQAPRPTCHHKVLFLNDQAEGDQRQVKIEGDVILFYWSRAMMPAECDKWPPHDLPEYFDGMGIKEENNRVHDIQNVTSTLVPKAKLTDCYRAAMTAWNLARDLDCNEFAKLVQPPVRKGKRKTRQPPAQ